MENIEFQKEWLDTNKKLVGEWIFVNGMWYEKEAYEKYVLSSNIRHNIMGIYPKAMNYLIKNFKSK